MNDTTPTPDALWSACQAVAAKVRRGSGYATLGSLPEHLREPVSRWVDESRAYVVPLPDCQLAGRVRRLCGLDDPGFINPDPRLAVEVSPL